MANRSPITEWRTGVVRRANDKGIWLTGEEEWFDWSKFQKLRSAAPETGTTVKVGLDKDGWLREWQHEDGTKPATFNVHDSSASSVTQAAPPPAEADAPVEVVAQAAPPTDDTADQEWGRRILEQDLSVINFEHTIRRQQHWESLLASCANAAAIMLTSVDDAQLKGRNRRDTVILYAKLWATEIMKTPAPVETDFQERPD